MSGQAHNANDIPIEVLTSGARRINGIYLHCPRCERTWLALRLPAPSSLAGKVLKLSMCAECHDSKSIVMATQEQVEKLDGHK